MILIWLGSIFGGGGGGGSSGSSREPKYKIEFHPEDSPFHPVSYLLFYFIICVFTGTPPFWCSLWSTDTHQIGCLPVSNTCNYIELYDFFQIISGVSVSVSCPVSVSVSVLHRSSVIRCHIGCWMYQNCKHILKSHFGCFYWSIHLGTIVGMPHTV